MGGIPRPCGFFKKDLLIYLWLYWVFVAVPRLSLVAVSRGDSSLWCVGFSLWWLLLLWSMDLRHVGSVVVAQRLWSTGSVVVVQRLSCLVDCRIFPEHGLNPCLLHWQVDSEPLDHQGSPPYPTHLFFFFEEIYKLLKIHMEIPRDPE